jgi:hypothetical protein
MLITVTGIDIVAIAVLPTAVAASPAVIATIERRRIPSARRRRESSRRRRGLAPSHPLHSFSSVAADVATDAVP